MTFMGPNGVHDIPAERALVKYSPSDSAELKKIRVADGTQLICWSEEKRENPRNIAAHGRAIKLSSGVSVAILLLIAHELNFQLQHCANRNRWKLNHTVLLGGKHKF